MRNPSRRVRSFARFLGALFISTTVGSASADDLWPPDRVFSDAPGWMRVAGPNQRLAARERSLGGDQTKAPVHEGGPNSLVPPERDLAEAEGEDGEPEAEQIETDRDSFTPATTTVGRGRLVLEAAHTFVDQRDVAETHSYPEMILRYGVSEQVELRVGWNYEVGGAGNPASGEGGEPIEEPEGPMPGPMGEEPRLERAARMLYGAKIGITRQRGLLPESAVILQGFTPTEGPSTTTTFVGTYVLGWKLLSGCKLDTAVRYGTAEEEGDRFGRFAPSVVLRVPLGERWNAHAEWFGVFTDDRAEDSDVEFFSPGLHWLVTPDLEIGTRVGWGLTDQSAKFFANTGVGLRF